MYSDATSWFGLEIVFHQQNPLISYILGWGGSVTKLPILQYNMTSFSLVFIGYEPGHHMFLTYILFQF